MLLALRTYKDSQAYEVSWGFPSDRGNTDQDKVCNKENPTVKTNKMFISLFLYFTNTLNFDK